LDQTASEVAQLAWRRAENKWFLSATMPGMASRSDSFAKIPVHIHWRKLELKCAIIQWKK